MNNLKTDGGPPDYIPPDDILDSVSTLLGSTADGCIVELGGDVEPKAVKNYDGDGSVGGDGGECGAGIFVECNPQIIDLDVDSVIAVDNIKLLPHQGTVETASGSGVTPLVKSIYKEKILMNTPRASGFKRKFVKPDDGRTARNLALAEYYNIKKKILDAKLENILLENEKLKLEIRELKKQY